MGAGTVSRRGFFAAAACSSAGILLGSACGRGSGPQGQSALPARRGPPRRIGGFAASPEAGGTLLVSEGGQGAAAPFGFRLNPVAAQIWNAADGTHSVEDIAQAVAERFQVSYGTALEDTRAFVGLLSRQKLLAE
jgi:hypothetical protein